MFNYFTDSTRPDTEGEEAEADEWQPTTKKSRGRVRKQTDTSGEAGGFTYTYPDDYKPGDLVKVERTDTSDSNSDIDDIFEAFSK